MHWQVLALGAIVGVSLSLMLWRPWGVAEAWWIGGGVALLLVLRLLPLRAAARAVGKGTDVYLFLTGMMMLSELAREHGLFDWLAANAVAHARGSRVRLLLLVYGTGTAVTALMSNDATAVVLTPAVLAAVKKTGSDGEVDPAPFLFACAMVANAASFLLPISNPANLVVFSKQMPALGHWLAVFLLPSIVSVALTFLALRWWFRRELRGPINVASERPKLSREGHWILFGVGALTVVLLIAAALRWDLGLPTCLCSLALVLVVSIFSREGLRGVLTVARGVSWSVLPLVAGLFCLVEAVDRAGLASTAAHLLKNAEYWPHAASVFGIGFGIGVLNNLVNNLPLGLLAGTAVQSAGVHGLLRNAVLIGVDLGPNLSVTGSLATILWLIRIRREGAEVSGAAFLRAGMVIMPVALAGALAVLLLLR